jgi:hypothetical protein
MPTSTKLQHLKQEMPVQPQQLEDNLSELELMLADSQVQANPALWDTNQASLKTLQSFLKAYASRLNSHGETEFLERQRHTLEFIVRCGATLCRRPIYDLHYN